MYRPIAVLYGDGKDVNVKEVKYNILVAEQVTEALKEKGYKAEMCPINEIKRLDDYSFDTAFNLCDGDLYTSSCAWCITKGLESRQKTFTGNSSECIRNAVDKIACRNKLKEKKLPVPFSDKQIVSFPFIIKPVSGHGSLNIKKENVIQSQNQYFRFFEKKKPENFYTEEFIEGREVEMCIFHDEAIGWSECAFTDKRSIQDFDYKWNNGCNQTKASTDFEDPIIFQCKNLAIQAFRAVGGTSYGRVDFRIKEKTPFIIDVNPNCFLYEKDTFYQVFKESNKSYSDMIETVLMKSVQGFDK